MKIKFTKNYLSYKADAVEEVDAEIAKELIAKGYAVEEKVDEEDITSTVTQIVEPLVKEAAQKGYEAGVKAGQKETIKGLKSAKPTIWVGEDNILSAPGKGFKNLGEFASTVKRSVQGNSDARNDVRLKALYAKAGMNEGDGVGADGAYAVPVDYASQIFSVIMGEDKLIEKCMQIPTKTNQLKLPIDSLTTIGTNAINGGFVTADGVTASPTGAGALNQLSFNLHKYISLVEATDELLDDNDVALTEWLTLKAGYDLDYKVNQGLVQGITNGGTGWVGNAATINISKESGQAAATVVLNNVVKMFAAFFRTPRATANSVAWVVGYPVIEQLLTMTDPSGRNIYFPAMSSAAFSPYGTLLGIPVIPSFHASALGSPGDISLVDLSAMVVVTKASGVQAAQSMHLYFAQDAMAFRFTFRLDNKPGITAPYTLADGSGSQVSPFITLATRA
jgi:HK97 family phage major capsid protein